MTLPWFARELLGKVLCSRIDGRLTAAVITETEAYAGIDDRASHAYGGRRTRRTEPMFAEGGIAYVYLCYGIHHLFNVVTGRRDAPYAVLVRAGLPLAGIDLMLTRRKKATVGRNLLAGPGSLACALGIRTEQSGSSLLGDRVWIEDREVRVPDDAIEAGPRIGVDYAGDDAARPYRFVIDANTLGQQVRTLCGNRETRKRQGSPWGDRHCQRRPGYRTGGGDVRNND